VGAEATVPAIFTVPATSSRAIVVAISVTGAVVLSISFAFMSFNERSWWLGDDDDDDGIWFGCWLTAYFIILGIWTVLLVLPNTAFCVSAGRVPDQDGAGPGRRPRLPQSGVPRPTGCDVCGPECLPSGPELELGYVAGSRRLLAAQPLVLFGARSGRLLFHQHPRVVRCDRREFLCHFCHLSGRRETPEGRRADPSLRTLGRLWRLGLDTQKPTPGFQACLCCLCSGPHTKIREIKTVPLIK
jgi:hypothetical protein